MHGEPAIRRGIDAVIAAIAAVQHGVVARRQLLAHGIGRGALEHRLATGRLYLIHRGVYAVGHPKLTRLARWMAAVLASGEGAVLSHRSAAELWDLLLPNRGRTHVIAHSGRHPGRGIVVHRTPLHASEITERNRIPVTTPVRTLLDLAAVVPREQLAEAFREAEAKDRVTGEGVLQALEARRGQRGAARLRAVLADAGYGTGVRRSRLEARFLRFLCRHRLPPPARNVVLQVGPLAIEADCLWWEQKLIVELDSRAFHETGSAFESDRARDRALAVHGWTVLRVTWRQVHRDKRQLARDLRHLLRRDAD